MTRSILLIMMFLTFGLSLSAQTILRGTVKDDTGKSLDFANIILEKDGVYIGGASTELDGTYSVPIDPGTYTVVFSMLGFQDQTITGVLVKSGKSTLLDALLVEEGIVISGATVISYTIPLVDKEGGSGGGFSAKQMQKLPTRNVLGAAATVPGINTIDDGSNDLNIGGARSNSTVFYLDDVRIRGPLPPATEIDQLEVMTGGIEAKYGDTGGGILAVTTKGPSGKFSGSLEAESSEYLDPYGYNLGYLNLAGPIITKKIEGGHKKTILGFRISGQYRQEKDDQKSFVPVYVASDEAKRASEANPTFERNQSVFSTAQEYTTIGKDGETGVDIWKLNYSPDEQSRNIALTTKLDARLTDKLQLTLTGTFTDDVNKFTPFGWQFMNSHNNPTSYNRRYRGIFRVRHKLGNWSGSSAEDEKGLLRNFAYTILASYQKREFSRKDGRYGDDLFAYGHAGYIESDYRPTLDFSSTPVTGAAEVPVGAGIGYIFQNGYAPLFQSYRPSDVNPGLSAYNPNGDAITGVNELLRPSGVARNTAIDNIWGQLVSGSSPLYKNANQVYNTYLYGSQDLASIQGNITFDIRPKTNSNHSISMGFQYEERVDVQYNLRPQALWNIAFQTANSALHGVDSTVILGVIDTIFNGQPIKPVLYGAELESNFDENKRFFKAIRDLDPNVGLNDYINIFSFSPSDLSMDMFAGSEIIGSHEGGRTLDYYGYDYLGNPVGRNTSFDDFFDSKDKYGNRNYPVAPARPIYLGGYIQDKFIYEDMIFKIGVRVDRYDANTKVLRDKYSLYKIESAGVFHNIGGTKDRPKNIGEDYKVYVTAPRSLAVKAYRNGDQWYLPSGEEVSGGNIIFGGGVVVPAYPNNRDKPVEIHEIEDENGKGGFKSGDSFKDYEPQWDISPRLSFSFPISDKANFFAHYDVYSQRPTSNTIMTPLDYFNFFNDGGTRNNPALRTQKSVDYAVGFQQKLSKSSALKLIAYYKELRDLIQRRTITNVPIAGRYTTFDNIDFATTKGFTFQYDLRRTNNVSLFASYSLQFVNGTGSDANSTRGLATRGVIRTTFPLSFDQRHTVQAILDYRLEEGQGMRVLGRHIFQNAGVNLLMSGNSGRPYTAKRTPRLYTGAVTEGSLNGSRLPWSFTVGMRVDKDFKLTKKGAKHPLFLNVYFRAANLFNTANIVSVYPATGSAYDDGYLTTNLGQSGLSTIVNSGQNLESYLNFYQWGLEDPNNFVLPRRLYMGFIFNF